MGRVDLIEQGSQRVRVLLKDIFDHQDQCALLSLLDQRPPCLEAALKPGFNIPIKFQSLVAGMEDDRLCLEKMGPKEDLEEPVEGDFLDSPVGASGAQVHEGSVDRCLQPIFLK